MRRAALTLPAAGDPQARVAGLTVLLRQLLSLQDAGIAEVDVELDERTRLALVNDPRLRLSLVPPSPAHAPPLLTAPQGLVWHRGLPARLVKAG